MLETERNLKRQTDLLSKAASSSSIGYHTVNDLLGQLSDDCLTAVCASAERVELNRRQVLFERNIPLRFAYFMESGAASIFAKSGSDGGSVEIRTVGAADFVGIPLALGVSTSPHRCVVQVPGDALRIPARQIMSLVEDRAELRRLLLGYAHAVLIYSSQMVACNTRHCLRERLARWLLVASDRIRSDDIALTHEVLARAIGVRRAGVTTEIGRLEQAGVIGRRYRGCISIIDRSGLERTSCRCYGVIRRIAREGA